jgi:hypothetical protein
MTAARKICLGLLVLATLATGAFFRQRAHSHLASDTAHLSAAPAAPRVAANSPLRSSWDERWQQWLTQLSAPGRDLELATEFEELVRVDPRLALTRARQEPEPRRSSLVQTILILWSGTDLAGATAEVRALPDSERALAVASVLSGAIDQPDEAVKLAVEFCRDDPALASEHGYALIASLGRKGEFRRAIRFAVENGNIGADEDHNKWLRQAFAQWAAENPTTALATVSELAEPGARFEALEAITANRVRTDPQGLAETLRLLPPGPDRTLVLAQALRGWVQQDPKTAADWLDRIQPSSETDAGAAAVANATQNHLQNRRPEVALSWAESIVASDLRSRTLANVVQRWATTDVDGARRYAESSTDLLADDRAALLKSLNQSAGDKPEAHE